MEKEHVSKYSNFFFVKFSQMVLTLYLHYKEILQMSSLFKESLITYLVACRIVSSLNFGCIKI